MSELAIRAEGISKKYRIGRAQVRKTIRESVIELARMPFAWTDRDDDIKTDFWALINVGFELQTGEVLGIIGRNGAGKSTLLKILSRITEPTEGCVEIFGRVGSLLEVGTGFHPELSGRENIFLNGAILGMRQTEIARKFDEIVEFAEIGKFLDTPVKKYSSGMYSRLAFSVAAHLEPEILIVDEVLAVGDSAFQRKCLGKIGEMAGGGRTVLFVSHNLSAIQKLCRRVIWLNDGQIKRDGAASQVVSDYLGYQRSVPLDRRWDDPLSQPGNDQVKLRRAHLHPESPGEDSAIWVKTPLVFDVEFSLLAPSMELDVALQLENEHSIVVFGTSTTATSDLPRPLPRGDYRCSCHIPGNFLNSGQYSIKLMMVQNQAHCLVTLEHVVSFEVHSSPNEQEAFYGSHAGVVRALLPWTTESL